MSSKIRVNEPSVNMIIKGSALRLCVSAFWFNDIFYLTFVPISELYKIDVKAINSGEGITIYPQQAIHREMTLQKLIFVDYIDWDRRVAGRKRIIVEGLDKIKQAVLDKEYSFMGIN